MSLHKCSKCNKPNTQFFREREENSELLCKHCFTGKFKTIEISKIYLTKDKGEVKIIDIIDGIDEVHILSKMDNNVTSSAYKTIDEFINFGKLTGEVNND